MSERESCAREILNELHGPRMIGKSRVREREVPRVAAILAKYEPTPVATVGESVAIVPLTKEEANSVDLTIMVEYGGFVRNSAEMMNSRRGDHRIIRPDPLQEKP